MKVSTLEHLPNAKVEKVLGVVRGNTVRARWFGADIWAGLKQLVGGEIETYTSLIAKAREEALRRMIKEAEKLGADAVLGVRFSTSAVMGGAAEILAYGTAVKLKKEN